MTTYNELVGAVADYYGTDSDIWRRVATYSGGNLTPSEIAALRQVPGVSVTVAGDGSFRGWDYNNPFPAANNPLAGGNSNVPNASYNSPSSFNGRVNGTYQWDGATQTGRLTSGARRVSTGARAATVAGRLNTAMTAVAAGMFFGAKIDSALYNIGKFFDLNPPESLNPETWDSIATTDLGKSLLRHLFDIGDDGKTTPYMPEDTLEYMYRYWLEQGMFNPTITSANYTGSTANFPQPDITTAVLGRGFDFGGAPYGITTIADDGYAYIFRGQYDVIAGVFISRSSSTMITRIVNDTVRTYPISEYGISANTYNGTPFWYNNFTMDSATQAIGPLNDPFILQTNVRQIGTVVFDGSITTSSPIPGISNDPNAAERPDPSQIDPSQPLLPQLKQQMPNTFRDPIKETVPQPDGTNKDIIYYPVPWPSIPTDTDKPVSGTPSQTDPTVTPTNPTDETDPLKDVITNPAPQPSTPTPGGPATPPDTGGGSSPTPVAPTGEASSMWAVYNPTQGQLDDFGSWLWSSNMVDQIKKLFADPMQAIIGVHKVYVTPPTGSQVNIKCGYIDSGCPAAKVTGQYVTVDCGTVNVREYYGNVLDYAPYTEVSLYLPFIGIVKLDVADVMRGSVNVKYHVDVITGACLAEVKVNRDGEHAIMYQYSGSAIVTYPVSSGSYASAVTGVLSLAAGVAGTIMTGGAAAPALIGGAVGLSHLHADVQHSGGFSGSPGAMGGKKPYLIISRAQDATPADFEKYEGKPASKTVKLSSCDGFIRVKSINIDAVPATYQELDQIVSLLKTGVII